MLTDQLGGDYPVVFTSEVEGIPPKVVNYYYIKSERVSKLLSYNNLT